MIDTSVQRYDIEEELGQGGMSVVYLGRDTTLERQVAVKVLHSHLARKEENRARFRREARAIARLQHENIVDVYDYSGEADEESYIVMEYVPGMNLRAFCEEHGHPPPEIAAMIGTVMADALTHAHDHGVIHRDLKPENVMVSEDGTLKLMDFGIAHVVDADTMTQTGNLLGSPAHMAPEIIDGQDVNIRSDIFSMGTVLYWLATGEFPFSGENAPQLLREVLECNFDPPDAVEPTVSRQLSQIIERCLARQPDDRFESVQALRDALADSLVLFGEDVDIDAELESYFNAPDAYVEEFESDIVDELVDLGHERMEQGQVPAAVATFNRVLAYDPNNPEVEGALDELDESPVTPARVAAGVAALAIAVVGMWWTLLRPAGPSGEPTRAASRAVSEAVGSAETRQTAVGEAMADSRRRADEVHDRSEWAVTTKLASLAAAHRYRRARAIAEAFADRQTASTTGPADPTESTVRARAPDDVEPPPVDTSSSDETDDAGASGDDAPKQEPQETFKYKFKVQPIAATVYIDGRKMEAHQALQGVELTRGEHHLRVVSSGCHTYESTFEVDGPASGKKSIVLEWKDATVRVVSNHPALVYLDGGADGPYAVDANGKNAQIRVPFGKVDPDRRTSKKEVTFEISPQANLEVVRHRTISLRPGARESIRVNFSSDTVP